MAKRGFDSTDYLQWMNYAWPVIGSVTMAGTATTANVALTTIEATDLVLATFGSQATVAYIVSATITAGTGFIVACNTTPGPAVVNYAVFKVNS